jgi:salicylate hydroxylase
MQGVEWGLDVLRAEFPSVVSFLVLVLLIAFPISMIVAHHSRGRDEEEEDEEQEEQKEEEEEKFDMHDGAVDVLIIGGGLGGLALAASLSKLGVHCLVVEKGDFRDAGAVLAVQPNGLKALKEISPFILTELEHASVRIDQTGGLMSEWASVRGILLEHVRACTDTVIIPRAYPTKLEIHSEGVRVTLHHIRSAQTEKILAHCVVAADGVHSSVRQMLGLAPAKDSGVNVVRAVVDCSMCPPLLSLCRKKGNTIVPVSLKIGDTSFFTAFNFSDVYEGKVRWTYITKSELPRDKVECKCHVVNEMHRYLSMEEDRQTEDWRDISTSSTPDSTAEPSDISMASCIVALTMPRNMNVANISTIVLGDNDDTAWGGRGRVTLIGDAAHAMRAASGQGSSMAFEDVCVLTRTLEGNADISKNHSRHSSVEATIVEEVGCHDEKTANSDNNEGPTLSVRVLQRIHDDSLLPQALRDFEAARIGRVRLVHSSENRIANAAYAKLKSKFAHSENLLGLLDSVSETDIGPLLWVLAHPPTIPDPYDYHPQGLCTPLEYIDSLRPAPSSANPNRDDSPISYEGNRSTKRMDMRFREWVFAGV